MIDSEILRAIRQEIKKHVNVILPGEAGTNTVESEDIQNLYPSMPQIPQRPVMHPYGVVSRAPKGTIQVTGRVGDHPGARVVMGHRDNKRPTLESGETILYDQFGHIVYLSKTKMQFGSKASDEPMVLGNVNLEFMGKLLDAFLNAPQIGFDVFSLPVFLDPAIRALLVQYKAQYLTAPSTNIVSQVTFTERGKS